MNIVNGIQRVLEIDSQPQMFQLPTVSLAWSMLYFLSVYLMGIKKSENMKNHVFIYLFIYLFI